MPARLGELPMEFLLASAVAWAGGYDLEGHGTACLQHLQPLVHRPSSDADLYQAATNWLDEIHDRIIVITLHGFCTAHVCNSFFVLPLNSDSFRTAMLKRNYFYFFFIFSDSVVYVINWV